MANTATRTISERRLAVERGLALSGHQPGYSQNRGPHGRWGPGGGHEAEGGGTGGGGLRAKIAGAVSRLRGGGGGNSKALVPAEHAGGLGKEGLGAKEARQWEKEMGRNTRGDARYTKEGIQQAARAPVDHEAISQVAARFGSSVHEVELEARMNMASIASVPREQISGQTRAYVLRSAARGEDTYAYPPISSSPRTAQWNLWYRGQRAQITELESYLRANVGNTVDATQFRLPPAGGGLSEARRVRRGQRRSRLRSRRGAYHGVWPVVDLRRIQLDEGADGFHRSWIMLFPEGKYDHPQYGKLDFGHKTLAEIKRNFDDGAREIEIAIDRDHKASGDDSRAMGWLERLELREGQGEGPAGLWALVRWTPLGLSDIQNQVYRYFSPEFKETYTNQLTGRRYKNVLIGGALTNRPFLKAMHAIQLAEVSHRPWSQIDKDCLPRSAFLIQGDAGHPTTWRLPVFEGVGPKDASGRYTRRGALNINGVRAALAAIGGARQSKPMAGVPAGVKARLQRWIARYGAQSGAGGAGSEASTAASERAGGYDSGVRSGSMRDSSRGMEATMGRGRAALKRVRDDELDEFDDTDDDGEGLNLADGGDDDSEEYADGDGFDGQGDDGEDDDGFDAESDTHGPMSTDGHKHGKYATHSHDGDGDHSDAELADDDGGEAMSSSRKASEARRRAGGTAAHAGRSRHGREMVESASVRQLREELASVRYQLYEAEVGKTLDGWRSNTFQFKESPKAAPKTGRLALSRVFNEKYRHFMLNRGIRLSEGDRHELNDLIETALSTAIVDLSARGSSFDQESRRTIRAGERNAGAEDSDRLEARVQQLLTEKGQTLAELNQPQTLALYERAAKEIGYH